MIEQADTVDCHTNLTSYGRSSGTQLRRITRRRFGRVGTVLQLANPKIRSRDCQRSSVFLSDIRVVVRFKCKPFHIAYTRLVRKRNAVEQCHSAVTFWTRLSVLKRNANDAAHNPVACEPSSAVFQRHRCACRDESWVSRPRNRMFPVQWRRHSPNRGHGFRETPKKLRMSNTETARRPVGERVRSGTTAALDDRHARKKRVWGRQEIWRRRERTSRTTG